jgi:UDP-2-acetamido-3-amino-2,3-dideoxy-glucuronate N-acetyltransferase
MGTNDTSLLAPHALHPQAFIDPEAHVHGDCVVKSGAHICRGVIIEAGCHVGANVVFVEAEGHEPVGTTVRRQAWIGANSTIYGGLTIAAKAVVRPGSVVTRSVPPGAIVEGNPAAIVGYVDTDKGPASPVHAPVAANGFKIETTPVHGVTVHHFPVIHDLRGDLTVGEFDRHVPFKPLRYFMVFGVPSREIRGEHAHHRCHQFLICLRGSCAVVADDGKRRVEVVLDSPQRGLYLPPMTWGVQYKYSPDAMLMVFASDYYDAADYIRDYGAFTDLVAAA